VFTFKELPEKFQQKALKLQLKEEDIVEQFIKGSGKGGQKINKTSSTVYLKHIPTAIELKCQKFRERNLNRIAAYKLLIQKIELVKIGKKSELATKIFKLKKQKQRRSKKSKEKILKLKHQKAELKESRKNINL